MGDDECGESIQEEDVVEAGKGESETERLGHWDEVDGEK